MKNRKLKQAIGYTSISLIGLIMLALVFPAVGDTSSALGEDVTMTSSLNTKTTAHLYSMISLATSGQIDLELVPKSMGSLEIKPATITVDTNNTSGYALYLSTVDGKSTLNQVDKTQQYANDNTNYVIQALPSTTTESNYLKTSSNLNTWGYALTSGEANANTEYHGLLAQNTLINKVSGTSSHDTYNLNIAVAVDTKLPAGDYRNGLIITAVTNPIVLTGFNSIYYMQDMTPEVCSSITIPDGELSVSGELVDKRDNTIYQVAKLKDGNCWMTQNLALDLSTEVALTPEDSDVSENWVPETSTEYDIPLPRTAYSTDMRSWNLGKVVLTNPTKSQICPTQTPPENGQNYPSSDQWNSVFTGQSLANTCAQYYKDVSSGWTANSSQELYSATSSINGSNYDPHYLIGNYYQWNTATAGTAIGITGTAVTNAEGAGLTNASGSICPKGWMLPKAGRNTSKTETVFGAGPGQSYDIDGSFYHLLKAYGYNTGWEVNDGNGYMPINDAGRIVNLSGSPMHFVRVGFINPYNGSIRYAGRNGYAWSKVAYVGSNIYSYYLGFNTNDLNPSDNSNRYNGVSVRCLAK